MPARSNDFHRIVKYVYEQTVPLGATVTESATLPEMNDDGREIDILVEHAIAGHKIRIAIECRNRSRSETIEWIDHLIGKYVDLKVSQIVAIASSPFTPAAKQKAAKHNIDLITVNEALTKDWRAAIEKWRFMQHSFTLMRIVTLKSNGEAFTYSEITADGSTATHRDQISEHMYALLQPFFMQRLRDQVGTALEAKIKERWQYFFDDSTPRWAEIYVDKPGLMLHGQPLDVERIVFGVGTFFHVGSPNDHFALREHALSNVVIKMMREDSKLTLIFDKDARPISIDFGEGKVFRLSSQPTLHSDT